MHIFVLTPRIPRECIEIQFLPTEIAKPISNRSEISKFSKTFFEKKMKFFRDRKFSKSIRIFWKSQNFLEIFQKSEIWKIFNSNPVIKFSDFRFSKNFQKSFQNCFSNILKFQIDFKLVLGSPSWKSVSRFTGKVAWVSKQIGDYPVFIQGE